MKSAKKTLDKQLIYRGAASRQSCEIASGVFIHARIDSKDFLRGRRLKVFANKRKTRLKFESNSIEKLN